VRNDNIHQGPDNIKTKIGNQRPFSIVRDRKRQGGISIGILHDKEILTLPKKEASELEIEVSREAHRAWS
jgi:hypothetical protein